MKGRVMVTGSQFADQKFTTHISRLVSQAPSEAVGLLLLLYIVFTYKFWVTRLY